MRLLLGDSFLSLDLNFGDDLELKSRDLFLFSIV